MVVTGLGTLCPIGNTADEAWVAALEGRSGVGPIQAFDIDQFPISIAGEVKGFDPADAFGRYRAKHLDRFTQLALVASRQAQQQAGLDVAGDPFRVGVVVGSGAGGLATMEKQAEVLQRRGPAKVSPYVTPMMCANMAAGEIAMETGAMGLTTCPVTACAAGANAIGDAFEAIRSGRLDAALAGGSDASVVPLSVAGFAAMKALSPCADPPRASRPFDASRDGFVLSEGAAVLVLEEENRALERGAEPLGRILGYGTAGDAHHPTAPHPAGAGARMAMQSAIEQAGLSPGDIDYVNAHGTSTQFNDTIEAAAVAEVIGNQVLLSSTKSTTGHLLGAAGALEAIFSLQAIAHNRVPPTINLDQIDPECDFDTISHVANESVTASVQYVLSNSFGFGGHNVSLVFGPA